jgi:hypothetical protein
LGILFSSSPIEHPIELPLLNKLSGEERSWDMSEPKATAPEHDFVAVLAGDSPMDIPGFLSDDFRWGHCFLHEKI